MQIKSMFQISGFEVCARKCTISDHDFVIGLIKKTLFPFIEAFFVPSIQMFEERFAHDYEKRYILMRGKRRIGMFQLTPRIQRLAITGLFLSLAYQGKGIAKHLMGYFEEVAIGENFHTLELSVWENNPAVSFYQKLGYSIERTEKHKYGMVKEF